MGKRIKNSRLNHFDFDMERPKNSGSGPRLYNSGHRESPVMQFQNNIKTNYKNNENIKNSN